MTHAPTPDRARSSRLTPIVPRVPIVLFALLCPGVGATSVAAQEADGLSALRAGRYDEAVRALRADALAGNGPALAGWVTALRETGDYEGAVRAAEQGVEREVAGAHPLLGAALLDLGRIPDARAALETGAADPGESGALARVELGILEYNYGNRDRARAIFDGFIDYYNSAARLTAAELTAVGRALLHLSRWNYEYAHDALTALDEAIATGPLDHAAQLTVGKLFLERYDARQAAEAFQQVLSEHPAHPGALLGLARVARLEGGGNPGAALEAALEANPDLAEARIVLARIRLLGGSRDQALEQVDRVLDVNPAHLEALGTKAAILHLARDDAGFSSLMDRIDALTDAPTAPLVVLSELSADHRKYEDALDFARQATDADPASWTGWGLMGLNQVRLGRVDEGRTNLERAFAGDPFNLWFKNTLDLLDTFGEYRIVETPHFSLVLHESEADLLAPYMEAVAERAYAEMSQRYGYAPEEPIRVEVYPRHADFSVRTVGLVGIGALGVSFGPALAIDSPAARTRGDFNWASTLWHEIAHSFHIAVSGSEVPRWFSEGLAVHEQRKADGGDQGWGHQAGVSFVRSLAAGELRPVSELDRGFSSPRHPGEVSDSYYQSSLVFELIEERHGFPAIVDMLRAYRDGASNEAAFERALGVRLEDFDADFEDFLRERFAAAIASVGDDDGEGSGMIAPANPLAVPDIATLEAAVARDPRRFVPRMALGQALFREGRRADAAEHFEAALELFPQYGGPDGAHWFLGRIREEQGDTDAAAAHYRAIIALNESHYNARLALGGLLGGGTGDGGGGGDAGGGGSAGGAGNTEAAANVLRELAHIHPYEIEDHERLAGLMETIGDIEGAVTARRAVVALNPVDLAAAHFRLASVLHRSGDASGARSAVLAALEIAPNYEEALDLLLELRRGRPGP
ncbi:MAG: tetratricopeptide repeat protein [Gemmatimonadetes bacterium]|nr:tetratricopeptide repeat protein [Gemmatimonadota bacterium]MCY3610911.1 tetratricopeptide repeat protein [Gemmatimonadota bacterium]